MVAALIALRFQHAEGLRPDGIVGPRTLRRLRVRADERRPTTSSPKSGARSPDRPTVGPAPQTRPAPAPTTVPTGPANRGPGRGVILLVALLALLALLVALLGLLVFAARQGRARTAGAAAASPADALPAGPAAPATESSTNGSSSGSANGSRPSGRRLGELMSDAVALTGARPANGGVAVAITDPSKDVLADLAATLGRRVEPRLTDEATLDELLRCVYGDADADEVTRTLREEVPELSAYRTMLSKAQTLLACVLGFVLAVGLLADLVLTATVLVAIATAFFVIATGFRLYAARKGCWPGATINPSDADLAALDARALPAYTILLPLYKEKPSTIRAQFDARGTLVTVYDDEDKPDPLRLKKAVWGFARVDDSVACLQAKLGYYNPRQNLLTRWFTLEFNKDADLGPRFARLGLTTAMLESTTGEEANSQVGNWLRQRSRWSKGYMQTLLVHTRRPLRLLRELGPRATAGFLLTIGGTAVTALLAPILALGELILRPHHWHKTEHGLHLAEEPL